MKLRINWDALGITTSVACAIHCAALPLFFSSLPLFGVNIIHNLAFEAGMVALAFVIGAWSLYHGYTKHHHKIFPFALFSLGITLLVFKLFFTHYETWLLIPAVVCIVAAHFLNYQSCRVQHHPHHGGHADCDHS